MNTNLIFCCGLTELLTCCTIVRERFSKEDRFKIVLYGQSISMPKHLVAGIKQNAHFFGEWVDIIDLTSVSDSISQSKNLDEKIELLSPWKNHFTNIDHIFLHTIWKPLEQSFIDLCSDAKIILYDNGLDSHMERAQMRVGRAGIRPEDLKRIQSAYYSIGEFLPVPGFVKNIPVHILSQTAALNEMKIIEKRGLLDKLRQSLPAISDDVAMVSGTAFYRTNKIPYEKETAVYRDFINSAASNNLHVIFKDHPRGPIPLDVGDMPSVSIVNSLVPFEFIPLLYNVKLAATISSTTVFTLKKIFDIPYVIIGNDTKEMLNLPWSESLESFAQKDDVFTFSKAANES